MIGAADNPPRMNRRRFSTSIESLADIGDIALVPSGVWFFWSFMSRYLVWALGGATERLAGHYQHPGLPTVALITTTTVRSQFVEYARIQRLKSKIHSVTRNPEITYC